MTRFVDHPSSDGAVASARWLATVVPVVVLLALAAVAWTVLGHADDLDGVIDAFRVAWEARTADPGVAPAG